MLEEQPNNLLRWDNGAELAEVWCHDGLDSIFQGSLHLLDAYQEMRHVLT